MAVGESVELHHNGSSSGYRIITPASGDEYCILRIAVSGNNWTFYLQDEGASGGGTTIFRLMKAAKDDYNGMSNSPHSAGWTCTDVKWYITPTCQLRLYSNSSNYDWNLTTVKSKD